MTLKANSVAVLFFANASAFVCYGEENSDTKPQKPVSVTVHGQAVDDETGKPVQNYIIQAGHFDTKNPAEVTWGFSERRSFGAGKFQTSIKWHEGWTARILADGYLPMPIVAKAPPAGKKRLELTIRLKPGNWVRGRVIDHENKPAVGASVFAVNKRGIQLLEGKAVDSLGGDDSKSALRALTDKNGYFELRVGEAEKLAVSSPEIHAWPSPLPEGNQPIEIRLPKPARLVIWYDIEGAGEEQEFFLQLLSHKMDDFKGVNVQRQDKTKRRETLVLTGLTPGEYQLARYRMVNTKSMGFGRFLDRKEFSLDPGERKVIRFLRPEGQQVEGQIVNLEEAKLTTALVTITPHPQPEGHKDRHFPWQITDALSTDRDGNFTTERLPPGTYKIKVEGYPAPAANERFFSGWPTPRYVAETKITVPKNGEIAKIELTLTDTQPATQK